jgi:hypothetical protein
MSRRFLLRFLALSLLLFFAPRVQAQASQHRWVAHSNEHAKVLLKVVARFYPEAASSLGIEGHDEDIQDLRPGHIERERAALKAAASELKQDLAAEEDRLVREDLEILVHEAETSIKGLALEEKYELPYHKLPETIFQGIKSLLDDQVAPARRNLVVGRMQRYAGLLPGGEPITKLAEARTRDKLANTKLLAPAKAEVEKDLANAGFFIEGIGELLTKYQIKGADQAYAALKQQLTEYQTFVRSEILPRARTDFRLPR